MFYLGFLVSRNKRKNRGWKYEDESDDYELVRGLCIYLLIAYIV